MQKITLYERLNFSMFAIKPTFLLFLLILINIFSLANAQTNSLSKNKSKINNASHSEIYRYKQNGATVYGDKIPNYSNVTVESISKRTGIILDKKRLSDEELQEKQRIKDEIEVRNAAKKIEDIENKELLSKYSSLKDIEDRKKYELTRISEVIQKDITTQVTLQEQMATMDREIKRDPGNKKRLEIEYGIIEKDIAQIKANLELNKTIYFERSSLFDRDKAAYVKILETAKEKK